MTFLTCKFSDIKFKKGKGTEEGKGEGGLISVT